MFSTSNILVSIVVPVLNERCAVEQLITSVCSQTYRPIELIFVDGGSSDGTRDLIAKQKIDVSKSSLKIILLFEENFVGSPNPAHARNIGINFATGDYLILLDSDTRFLGNSSLNRLKELLDIHDFLKVKTKFDINTSLEEQIAFNYPVYYHCGYKRWLFNNVLFKEQLGYGEDRDLWWKIEKTLGIKVSEVNETLLIRHLPHTKYEYFNQAVWYGKSYPKFIGNVLLEKQFFYLKEITFFFFGCILSICFPLFAVVSFLRDLKNSSLTSPNFLLTNLFWRYLFFFHLLIASASLTSIKNHILCVSIFFKKLTLNKKIKI